MWVLGSCFRALRAQTPNFTLVYIVSRTLGFHGADVGAPRAQKTIIVTVFYNAFQDFGFSWGGCWRAARAENHRSHCVLYGVSGLWAFMGRTLARRARRKQSSPLCFIRVFRTLGFHGANIGAPRAQKHNEIQWFARICKVLGDSSVTSLGGFLG